MALASSVLWHFCSPLSVCECPIVFVFVRSLIGVSRRLFLCVGTCAALVLCLIRCPIPTWHTSPNTDYLFIYAYVCMPMCMPLDSIPPLRKKKTIPKRTPPLLRLRHSPTEIRLDLSPRLRQMDPTLLLPSPRLPLSISEYLRDNHSSTSSPILSSPLALSSTNSPVPSPRMIRSQHLPAHLQLSTLAHSAHNVIPQGPGSATGSEGSHSPIDSSLDFELDSFSPSSDYDFSTGLLPPSASRTPDILATHIRTMEALKEQALARGSQYSYPVQIAETDGESYIFNGPAHHGGVFVNPEMHATNIAIKSEFYSVPTISAPTSVSGTGGDMGAYAYLSMTPDSAAPHYTASPASPFVDTNGYFHQQSQQMDVNMSVPTYTLSAAVVPQQHVQTPTYSDGSASDELIYSAATETHVMHMRHQHIHHQQSQGGCDPRVVGGSPPSSVYGGCSSAGADGTVRFAGAFGSVDGFAETDADDREFDVEGEDSGEDEKTDESDGDYMDLSFVVPSHGHAIRSGTSAASSSRGMYVPTQSLSSSTRHSSRLNASGCINGVSSGPSSMHRVPSQNPMSIPSRSSRPSAPVPVPVPNLTKKSRGRRVPTFSSVVVNPDGVTKRTRGYTCRVPGCGKCFARGEHLKRHIRSIHTNEKREWSFFC